MNNWVYILLFFITCQFQIAAADHTTQSLDHFIQSKGKSLDRPYSPPQIQVPRYYITNIRMRERFVIYEFTPKSAHDKLCMISFVEDSPEEHKITCVTKPPKYVIDMP